MKKYFFSFFFISEDLFIHNDNYTYTLLDPNMPDPLPIPVINAPQLSQAIKTLLTDSQPMSIKAIFSAITRLFPNNQEFTLRDLLIIVATDRDSFLCDWHEHWYRPLTPVRRRAAPAKWISFTYANSGRFKKNVRLQADIKRDLGESALMIADAGDICSMEKDKAGPAEFIQFLEYLEDEYDVFKVKSGNLDLGALLMVIPVTYEAHFVYSSPCFYAEANVLSETLKKQCEYAVSQSGPRRGADVDLCQPVRCQLPGHRNAVDRNRTVSRKSTGSDTGNASVSLWGPKLQLAENV